uniref:G-protein coupled receptors family 2 profile 2 domain-containing protein n=1 Tax=Anopheles farauti TaxID=69004 RepID=A0A182QRK9_9DIPT
MQVPYCNWTWDSILCWPPAAANSTIRQRCPPAHGIDTSKFAERRCSAEGQWEGRPGSPPTLSGWTNYTPCYSPEVIQLFRKLYAGGSDDEANVKIDIAERTRTLETVGFSLSLVAGLRNNRTRIHKNLFVAMVIQVVIRLTLYIDQAIIRSGGKKFGSESSRQGIDNTPFLCEASYVLLEYARTCMFMWMFIEGLYLHNVVTVTVFQGRFPHTLYAIVGWGGPVVLTVIWAITTAQYIRQQKVLIVKLRQSHTSDVEQVRKAVRAAVVLVPLLGITNILNMTQAPLDKTALEFAIWSYVTHFLTSFQGFFIALLYCFLNGEVRTALMKSISVYLSLRGHHDWTVRRQSLFSAGYPTVPANEAPHAAETNRNTNRNAASNNLLASANNHTANGGMASSNSSANGFRCGWFSRCFLAVLAILTPVAGHLVATERCLCRQHVVRVDPNRAGTQSLHQIVHLIDILRKDGRCQPVVGFVRPLDHLVERFETYQLLHRAKDFFLRDRHVILHVRKHGRLDEETGQIRNLGSSRHQPGPLLLSGVDQTENFVVLILVHLRTVLGGQIERIAHRTLLRPLGTSFDKLVVDFILDEGARTGTAALTHVEEQPKLERGALKIAQPGTLLDLFAHLGRTGERHLIHVRMINQRSSGISEPGNHINHTGAVKLVCSAGFKMMVLPVAKAGPNFHAAMRMGKFHGMI